MLNDREVSNFILLVRVPAFTRLEPRRDLSRATPGEFVKDWPIPSQIELLDRDPPDIKNGSLIWSTSIRVGDMLPPDRPFELLPGGSWNRAEVELHGDSLRVTINGNRILTTDLNRLADRPDANPALKRRAGRIGFQSLTGTVRFRQDRNQGAPHRRRGCEDRRSGTARQGTSHPPRRRWNQKSRSHRPVPGGYQRACRQEQHRAACVLARLHL